MMNFNEVDQGKCSTLNAKLKTAFIIFFCTGLWDYLYLGSFLFVTILFPRQEKGASVEPYTISALLIMTIVPIFPIMGAITVNLFLSDHLKGSATGRRVRCWVR